jgi:hypothetical protein
MPIFDSMDEFKIIFWVILFLVYIFARKKKETPPPSKKQKPLGEPNVPSSGRPLTFEELLREIQTSKAPKPAPHPTRPTQEEKKWEPKRVDYDDDIPQPKVLEDTGYDYRNQDRIYEVYENAKKQAFERPSLEESLKLEDTIVRFQPAKPYERSGRRGYAADFRSELKKPESFRKAFLMSEILARKF